MPWRTSDEKKLVQFFVGLPVPFHVTKARKKRGLPSASAYYRELIVEGLSKDLGIDAAVVRSWMPPTWEESPGAVRPARAVSE